MRSTILIAACILAVIAADASHASHKAAAAADEEPTALTDMGKKLLWVAFLGLAMPTGHGVYIREFDGREFFYARYVDWAFTTPLQLLDICGFAGAFTTPLQLLDIC